MNFRLLHEASKSTAAIIGEQDGHTVLVTVVIGSKTDKSFLPLSIEYTEKDYANLSKQNRKDRVQDEYILKARAIDRSIRPLFNENFRYQTQIIVTILSLNPELDILPLVIDTTYIAATVSGIPFNDKLAAVRVGLIDSKPKQLISLKDISLSSCNLLLTGSEKGISMIEFDGLEIQKDDMSKLISYAQKKLKEELSAINSFLKVNKPITELINQSSYFDQIDFNPTIASKLKVALYKKDHQGLFKLKSELIKELETQGLSIEDATMQIELLSKQLVRDGIIKNKVRISGRKVNEIREIKIEKNILPIKAGSAIFSRGVTSVLGVSVVTPIRQDDRYTDKNFTHQYISQPFSLGTIDRINYNPGRRELGHGMLAEKALRAVIPDIKSYPFSIKSSSDVLAQSGSSSMASVSAGSLSLKLAGVPISNIVGGISIGLYTIKSNKGIIRRHQLVVDMEEMEDFYGDMDFKLAATNKGITAIQMDNKLGLVPFKIIQEACALGFLKANEIAQKISKSFPKEKIIKQVKIEMIIDETKLNPFLQSNLIHNALLKFESKLDFQKDKVIISSVSRKNIIKVKQFLNEEIGVRVVGQKYKGTINGVQPYGLFVKVFDKFQGLLHASKLPIKKQKNLEQHYKVGQKVTVVFTGYDTNGKVSFA